MKRQTGIFRQRKTLGHALTDESPFPSKFRQIKASIQDTLAFGSIRNQQMDEMLPEAHRQKSEEEKKIDRSVVIAVASSALSIVGQVYFWPLQLIGGAGVFYVTTHVYRKAFREAKQGKVSVSTLVTVVILGSLLTGHISAGGFVAIIRQLSLKMRHKVTQESKSKLIDVFRQHPDLVWLMVNDVEIQVPFDSVKTGDVVVVNTGEMIPIDGIVIEGVASVDQHILTGESTLVEKSMGERVFASTTVLSGKIHVEVEEAGDETTVAKIGDMLNKTREFKSTAVLRAEKLVDQTIMPTLIAGGVLFPFLGPMGTLAVLNSHFKYKMSVVAPISIMNFLNIASRQGILIKDGRTLDFLSEIDTIVFDKTGTLTEEQPHVGSIHTCADIDEQMVLSYAASAEYRQAHPIAKAIVEEAEAQQLEISEIDEAEYKLGYGLTVSIKDKLVRVGSARFMEISEISIPLEIEQVQTECHQQAHSLVMVAVGDQLVGAVELVPTIRPEARSVIKALRERDQIKEMYIISGDHTTPTRKLAEELQIDHYFAETLPQDKAELIGRLQEEGKKICFIGDGINDAIALKKSQVSVSLRGASSVATDTAQIVFMDSKLDNLVTIFELAEKFHKNINMTFMAVTAPAVVCLGGVLFLNFGLPFSVLLNGIGFAFGLGSSMLPLFQAKSIQKQSSTEKPLVDTFA